MPPKSSSSAAGAIRRRSISAPRVTRSEAQRRPNRAQVMLLEVRAAEAEAARSMRRLLRVLERPAAPTRTTRKAADDAYLAVGYLSAVLRRSAM